MSRRLKKELHPLLIPGLVAAVAAIAPLLLSTFRSSGTDEALSFFAGLALLTFICTIALVACLPFGVELQERTLPLLLSQPQSRSRAWAEKLLAVFVVVTALVWLQSWTNQHNQWSGWRANVGVSPLSRQDELLMSEFLVITICAGGFWTLVARSTIGGVAFTLASQLVLMLGSGHILDRFLGYDLQNTHEFIWSVHSPVPVSIGAGAIYAAVLLWVGWRRFANLELKSFTLGQGAAGETSTGDRLWPTSLLHCRPKGYVTNLVRKELHLQKPVLLIAALASLSWLTTLTLCWLTPARKDFFEGTANVLTGIFMVLVPLLAGCISLGEEKVLGLHSWQLTLPIAARKQWWVKLAVGAGVAIGLGVVLPYVLAWLSCSTMDTGLAQALRDTHRSEVLLTSLAVIGVPFLLSFWAATMLGNTVRSAVMAIAGLVVLFACAALGVWTALKVDGIETGLLKFIIAHFHLSGESSQRAVSSGSTTIVGYLSVAVGIGLLLRQSLAQFRRVRIQNRAVAYCSASIAGLAFLVAFWIIDLQTSHRQAWGELKNDVANALQALPEFWRDTGISHVVSIAELENTGQLSNAAKTWLAGAMITLQPVEVKGSNSLPDQRFAARFGIWRVASIRFPNGQLEFVGPYEVLRRPAPH